MSQFIGKKPADTFDSGTQTANLNRRKSDICISGNIVIHDSGNISNHVTEALGNFHLGIFQ